MNLGSAPTVAAVLNESVTAIDAMLRPDHPVKVAAREWADEVLPKGADRDKNGVVGRDTWKAAADYGVLGLHAPKSHGGREAGAVYSSLVLEGMGCSAADNGVTFALASQALAATRAIAMVGTPSQLDRWMTGLVDGSYFASFAMSEPESGSHPWSITTTATESPDGGWRLDGEKIWATLAPIADVAVVFAQTDPDRGQWGISAFVVDLAKPGVTRHEVMPKMGIQSCPWGRLTFEDTPLDDGDLLGRPGSGAAIFTSVIEAERAFLYAGHLGAVESVIARSVEHARSRIQGDAHIGSHQAVSHRIVDMKVRHEAARLLLYKAAALFDAGESSTLSAAMTKLFVADAGVETTVDAMRTFGAAGYAVETGIEAEVRDALAGLSYSGTLDVTRNLVASFLGLNRRT